MKLSRGKLIVLFVILLLIIDQAIKFAIKLNMTIGESIPVFGNWFQIYFIENNGMAFGMEWGGSFGKLLLSLFRVGLIGFIIHYLYKLIRQASTPVGVLVGIALILVGAMGNVVDSLVYGVIFNESTYTSVATLFPEGGGYAPVLFGKVVDMFYFPIITSQFPDWFPVWGGEEFVFFRPIFNFADACISCGVAYIVLFQRKFFAPAVK